MCQEERERGRACVMGPKCVRGEEALTGPDLAPRTEWGRGLF